MKTAAQVANSGLDHFQESGLVRTTEPLQHSRFELGDGQFATGKHAPAFRRQACGSFPAVIGVRDALDQPRLLEVPDDLVHGLRGHERTPR